MKTFIRWFLFLSVSLLISLPSPALAAGPRHAGIGGGGGGGRAVAGPKKKKKMAQAGRRAGRPFGGKRKKKA